MIHTMWSSESDITRPGLRHQQSRRDTEIRLGQIAGNVATLQFTFRPGALERWGGKPRTGDMSKEFGLMSKLGRFRFCKHDGYFCKSWFSSRNVVVMVHPLRLLLRELSEHDRIETHAKCKFKRPPESKVLGDQYFVMLGDNFGHDRG